MSEASLWMPHGDVFRAAKAPGNAPFGLVVWDGRVHSSWRRLFMDRGEGEEFLQGPRNAADCSGEKSQLGSATAVGREGNRRIIFNPICQRC